MKKLILLLIISVSFISLSQAQELTFEYNFGFGTYKMGNLKDFFSENDPTIENGTKLKNLKMTDNFPGHFTNQIKVGLEIHKMHHAGISLDFINTVGQKAVSDYSGEYYMKLRVKGTRLGAFYRISPKGWISGIVRPYLMFTTGIVLNNGELDEKLTVSNTNLISSEFSFNGVNFFIEPALGCKIRLHRYFALNLNVGYQVDVTKNFKDKDNRYQIALKPDWSGLRAQGGLIYYLSLR